MLSWFTRFRNCSVEGECWTGWAGEGEFCNPEACNYPASGHAGVGGKDGGGQDSVSGNICFS